MRDAKCRDAPAGAGYDLKSGSNMQEQRSNHTKGQIAFLLEMIANFDGHLAKGFLNFS